METLKDFFDRLHAVDFIYCVMRNWENLPNDVCLGEHSDLDIMVYDFNHFCEVIPTAKRDCSAPRVRMKIPIGDSHFYCDVRSVSDGYYPEDFANAMLVTREWNPNGFYTPNPVHHRLALVYHAVHHKQRIAHEYVRYLGDVTIEELFDGLKSSSIGWSEPSDPTVGRFYPYWKGATSIVEKKDGRVFKRQTGYSAYPLIEREWMILNMVHSLHFPKVYSFRDGVIEMEDCGVSLINDIPPDWESQMSDILEALEQSGVQHRDIRLDNLMVKDGIIKLIDFGWAKSPLFAEEKEPPSCLGIPNKPSEGWSDSFSVRSVSKQINYILEERNETV